MAMPDSQRYILQALSDPVWIRYQFLFSWKFIIFNYGFSSKVTGAKLVQERYGK